MPLRWAPGSTDTPPLSPLCLNEGSSNSQWQTGDVGRPDRSCSDCSIGLRCQHPRHGTRWLGRSKRERHLSRLTEMERAYRAITPSARNPSAPMINIISTITAFRMILPRSIARNWRRAQRFPQKPLCGKGPSRRPMQQSAGGRHADDWLLRPSLQTPPCPTRSYQRPDLQSSAKLRSQLERRYLCMPIGLRRQGAAASPCIL